MSFSFCSQKEHQVVNTETKPIEIISSNYRASQEDARKFDIVVAKAPVVWQEKKFYNIRFE